jgi:hypothetical protein
MTMAIRIIRSPRPTDANLYAVEREEQILSVARRVVEASGMVSQDRIDECAEKIRCASLNLGHRSTEQIANDVTWRIGGAAATSLLAAHSDMDMDRILALLEG